MALYSPLLIPIMIVIYESFLKESGYTVTTILFSTLIIITVSFVYAIFSFKCRYCGAKIFWMAISKIEKVRMQKWIKSLEVCPICGRQ